MPPRRFKAAAKAPDTSSPTSSAMGSALAERTSTSPGTRRAGSSACSAGSLRKDVGQHSRSNGARLRSVDRLPFPYRCPSAARRTPRGSRAVAAACDRRAVDGAMRVCRHCSSLCWRAALPPPHRCRDGQGPGVGGRWRGGRVGAEETGRGRAENEGGRGAGRAARSVRPLCVHGRSWRCTSAVCRVYGVAPQVRGIRRLG